MPSRVARGCDRPRATGRPARRRDTGQTGQTDRQSVSQSVGQSRHGPRPGEEEEDGLLPAARCKGEDVTMGLSPSSREEHASTWSAVLTGLDPPGPWIGRGRFWKGQNRALIGRRLVGRRHTDFTTGHGGRFLSDLCGGRAWRDGLWDSTTGRRICGRRLAGAGVFKIRPISQTRRALPCGLPLPCARRNPSGPCMRAQPPTFSCPSSAQA